MLSTLKKLSLTVAMTTLLSIPAWAGELVINYDGSDPAPKKAFEEVIQKFETANPDIKVKWNIFDHEGYKTSIRNFLTANPPDVFSWYAANRMAPFVKAGLVEDVTDLWEKEGLNDAMASAADAMTIDSKKWGVPYTYYQWGIYYRKDLFDKHGIAVPTKWDEFLAACAKLKENGITPIAIGTKQTWTTGGVFDYINMRVNGYEVHKDLTAGKIKYTDPQIQKTFDHWDQLVKPGYFLENHATFTWQEALAPMVQGKAAMYIMGNFAVAPLKEAGLTNDQLGFFQFPEITPNIEQAEDAPTDTFHISSKAKNKEDARKFLAFLASPDVQTSVNKTLGQLPINKNASVDDDPFIKAGFEMLSKTKYLGQFYDRDADAEMAKAGMDGFQEYMIKPERREAILKQLDKVQEKVNSKQGS